MKAEITIFFPSFTTLKRVFFKPYSLYKPIIIYILGYWGRDRCLGCGDAIAFGSVGSAIAFGVWECDRLLRMWRVRSLFGVWECDRFWGCGGCDRFLRMFGVRSLLGCGDVIAVWDVWGWCDRFLGFGSAIAFRVWECDRCWEVWRVRSLLGMLGVRSLFGMLGMRSILGCGSAIYFGMWECDRFWVCGDAIAFGMWGMWGCDQKIKLPHLRMVRDPLNLSLHAKPVEPPLVPLELYKKSNSP